ncbi:MAG: zinc-binding alcohol dehydrogenase [Spirochaetes bacterium]|nr:zinc-binding alcohol dehydrogenase [Spirochaetota bacterium]
MVGKRLVFTGVRKVEWEFFDIPEELKAEEILVRAQHSLISPGTELAIYTGSHMGFSLPIPPFPLIPSNPGYAMVGEVVRTGLKVGKVQIGDRVLVEAPHGTFAIVNVEKNPPIILPETIPNDVAPFIRMAKIGITALRSAPPQLGESVLVFGMGIVGLLCGQLYRLGGARPVVGTDLLQKRLDLASRFGIIPLKGVYPEEKEEFVGALRKLLRGEAPSIVLEATGNPTLLPLSLELSRDGGRVVLLGSTRGKVQLDAYSLIHRKGISLIGAHERVQDLSLPALGGWNRIANQGLLSTLFAENEIQTEGLITHRILASEAPMIYPEMALKPDDFLGVLLDWTTG